MSISSFARQLRDIIQVRQKSLFCGKFIQEIVVPNFIRIAPEFFKTYYKKHFGLFFWTQCTSFIPWRVFDTACMRYSSNTDQWTYTSRLNTQLLTNSVVFDVTKNFVIMLPILAAYDDFLN